MTLPNQKMREAVLVSLFASLHGGTIDALDLISEQLKISKKYATIAVEKARLVSQHLEAIDSSIEKHAIDYTLARIPQMEKTILRLAVYELVYDDTVPESVAIAEAVRLAAKFSTKEASRFVNAVVDAIRKELTEALTKSAAS